MSALEAHLAQCTRFDPEVFRDLYRDVTGSRPRFDLLQYTPQELDEMYNYYSREADVVATQEAAREVASVATFRALIEKMVADHNITRLAALRWLAQAQDIELDIERFASNGAYTHGDQDASFLFWHHGITSFACCTEVTAWLKGEPQ
jgi:hypothetical protein